MSFIYIKNVFVDFYDNLSTLLFHIKIIARDCFYGIRTLDPEFFLSLPVIGFLMFVEVALMVTALSLWDTGFGAEVWGGIFAGFGVLMSFICTMIYARGVVLPRLAEPRIVYGVEVPMVPVNHNLHRVASQQPVGYRGSLPPPPPPSPVTAHLSRGAPAPAPAQGRAATIRFIV